MLGTFKVFISKRLNSRAFSIVKNPIYNRFENVQLEKERINDRNEESEVKKCKDLLREPPLPEKAENRYKEMEELKCKIILDK